MKVTILGKWPGEKLRGGVDHVTINLVQNLSKLDGLETHVISFGDESKTIKIDNTKITLIKTRKLYYIFPFLALMRLFQELKKQKPDVIHVQGSNFSPYIIVGWLLRNKYPSVLILLGMASMEIRYDEGGEHILWRFFNSIAEKYFITKFQNLIVETNSIKNILNKQTNSKIYVISSGVDFNKFQKVGQDKVIENPDIFVASRLEKLKGIDLLIESIPIVMKSIPNLKVHIAGFGSQENELKDLVKRLNLESHVRFLGFISEEEKYQFYKSCKVFVVPSRWDCQPITLFEAAASGVPVIASEMSNPGIVEDGVTGFIFKSEDIYDLANKIVFLLNDDELIKKMGKTSKEKALLYDWSRLAENFVRVYKEIHKEFYNQ